MENNITLSIEQKFAFQQFKKGHNLFITGPGGTGKTQLIKHFVEYMINMNINHKVCAMTGCAAVLLKCRASTLHSWSGIKLAKGETQKIVNSVLRNKKALESWRGVKVLIIDEVSMMSQKIFELCDLIGKHVRKNDKPFGGIQIIFTGDFFQLPPVGDKDGNNATSNFCFQSKNWFHTFKLENHILLKTIFRQNDPTYIDILMQIREGKLDEKNIQILKQYVRRPVKDENGYVPTKLFAVRSKTDFVNSSMYSKIQDEEFVYNGIDRTDCALWLDSQKPFDSELRKICQSLSYDDKTYLLKQFKTNANILENVSLKKGSLVMCTYNVDVEIGICNGSQGVIIDFVQSSKNNCKIPIVSFNNGITSAIDYQFYQSEEFPCLAIGQIPLCLAWALTIHKIQGSTLKDADIDLGNSIFEYGQTYVGLSRVKSLEGLYLSAFIPHRIKANPLVQEFYQKIPNIDYSELLPKISILEQEIINNELVEEPYEDDTNTKKIVLEKNIFESFACDDSPNTKRVYL